MKFLGPPQSGSYQGLTSSRNRFGQYIRSRAIPVQPRTSQQLDIRARLTAQAALWRTYTDVVREAWTSLGLQMLRTDSLGQSNPLTGFSAAVSVNNVLATYGQSVVSDAPLIATPTEVGSVVLTATAGVPTFTVATTGEPGAGFIGIYASRPQSQGRSFIPGLKLITTSAVGGSPYNILTAYTERCGTLVAGQKIAVLVRTMVDGFESLGFSATVIVGA